MRFVQVRDILDHTKEFHKRLSEIYQDLADHEEGVKIKLLLDYIVRHEQHLEKALADYEESASIQILDTWFQFSQDESTLKFPEDIQIKPGLSLEDVIRIGLELDGQVIKVYEDAAANADVPEIRQVFKKLLELEKHEEHHLVRAALESREM